MIFGAHVFDDNFTPSVLTHRNQELTALAKALGVLQSRHDPDDVLIAGPPGIGKTTLVEYLRSEHASDSPIEWVHVRCLGETTDDILRDVARDLTRDPIPSDMPLDQVRSELARCVSTQTVVVLDDADDVPDTNVLNELAGILHLSVVAICHDRDRWLSRLDDHHRTRFQTVIEPDRYSATELADILLARAKQGLARNAFSEHQLRDIAEGAAGVPRYAIQSLRAAAELAEERNHAEIREADVTESFGRARGRVRELTLQSLDYHHHVLYELIRSAGDIPEDKLHEQYVDRAGEWYRGRSLTPLSDQPRRNRLSELERYDLIRRPDGSSGDGYSAVEPALRSRVTPRVEAT